MTQGCLTLPGHAQTFLAMITHKAGAGMGREEEEPTEGAGSAELKVFHSEKSPRHSHGFVLYGVAVVH